jgi:peptidyl-prolyl cis-trans isomerase C
MDITLALGIKPVKRVGGGKISVNGVEISRQAIAAELQNHPAANAATAWQIAARALSIRELLLQEARRLNVVAEPISDSDGRRETEEEALIRSVVEREVRTPEPDRATCHRYYEQNRHRFRSPDLLEVDHILIAAAPSDKDATAKALDVAAHLIEVLQQDDSQFAALARAHSVCPSRDVDGSLGQIGPGQTVEEFETALAAIEAGRVHHQPVRTRYGVHVIRVNRRIEGRELPFDLVETKIAEYLAERVRHTAIRQYLAILAGRATITGVDLGGASSPLIQ